MNDDEAQELERQRSTFAGLGPALTQLGGVPAGGERVALDLVGLSEATILWSSTMTGLGERPRIVRTETWPGDPLAAESDQLSWQLQKAVQVLVYLPWGHPKFHEIRESLESYRDGPRIQFRLYAALAGWLYEWWLGGELFFSDELEIQWYREDRLRAAKLGASTSTSESFVDYWPEQLDHQGRLGRLDLVSVIESSYEHFRAVLALDDPVYSLELWETEDRDERAWQGH